MAKKILIIDDEIDVMKMLVYRLKAKRFEVYTAVSGKEGINLAKAQTPDLIILDYRLPDMGGPEVSKKIKGDEDLRQIPIILITASIDGIESKAKECQAVDYLTKPIGAEELYEKVALYVKQ
jgi:CheY-like chemotaxis protein